MHGFNAALIAASLALGACTPTTGNGVSEQAPPPVNESTAPQDPRPTAATCNADAAKAGALGKPASEALLEQARQQAGAQTARFLRPGEGITKEFRADRLNVHLDENDTVRDLQCG